MAGREQRVIRLIEEHGFDERGARFTGARANGKSTGCVREILLPPSEDEARYQAELLVEYLDFTPDEAARYVAGDRSAIEAVAARRLAADERDMATADTLPPGSTLGGD